MNIRDAYKDTRFFPGVDRQTGYRTKGVICYPIKFSISDRVEAVIQAINKKSPRGSMKSAAAAARTLGSSTSNSRRSSLNKDDEFCSFNKADESMLSYLASEAAMCLQNAKRMEKTSKEARKNAMLAKVRKETRSSNIPPLKDLTLTTCARTFHHHPHPPPTASYYNFCRP